MSSWSTISFKFTALDPLKPPLQATLSALEAIEAVLEALLDIIKPFLLDLTNSLKAIVALLLAAIRAIINQIKSTGFSILLVHPDFSHQDFGAVLNSVSGAYPRFESKVVGKFFDTTDLFRPTYGPGSSIGMLVLYIGADSPGDLMSQLFALLNLIKHPLILSGLPAPVSLKVRPVKNGGDPIAQFRNLFDSDLDQSLSLQWRMPEGPTATGARGFVGQLSAFYNSFRFPNFLVERTDDQNPQGVVFKLPAATQTLGKNVDTLINRYNFPTVSSSITVREENGDTYRNFPKKIVVGGSNLLEGKLTGSYEYLDNDPALVPGNTYYYRVRAYFGDISDYLGATTPQDLQNAGLIKKSGNQIIVRFGQGVVMGKPSPTAKGFVPRPKPTSQAFDAYNDIVNAIIAGILLNFEFPAAGPGDTDTEVQQKTGWGTLGILGGQIGPLKAAFSSSDDIKNNFLVKTTARRLTNSVLTNLYNQPAAFDLLSSKWVGAAQAVVDKLFNHMQSTWKFIGIIGGITPQANADIATYLALESTYVDGQPLTGPVPITGSDSNQVTVEDRNSLSDFLRTAIAMTNTEVSYLAWYSVTVGDLFPALLPLVFDFEQFLLSFLKALNSALQEIVDIIQTLIQQIQSLEAILETILALLELFDVNVRVSLLAVGPTQGSVSDLVSALQNSDAKPAATPFGLHSGMVMTFGGPGAGSVAALNAIKFILTITG